MDTSRESYKSMVRAMNRCLDEEWLDQFVDHAVGVINSFEEEDLPDLVRHVFDELAEICDLAQSGYVDVSSCRRALEALSEACSRLSQNIMVAPRVVAVETVYEVPLDAITVGNPFIERPPFNPSDNEWDQGLVDSIARFGQVFPVSLWRTAPGEYLAVDGRRRIAALRCLGRSTVNAILAKDHEPDGELRVVEAREIYKIPLGAVVEVSPCFVRAPFDPSAKADRELMDSIKEHRQYRPVCLTEIAPGRYQVVYGHRRIDALSYLGRCFVNAFLIEGSEFDLTTLTAIENARMPLPAPEGNGAGAVDWIGDELPF